MSDEADGSGSGNTKRRARQAVAGVATNGEDRSMDDLAMYLVDEEKPESLEQADNVDRFAGMKWRFLRRSTEELPASPRFGDNPDLKAFPDSDEDFAQRVLQALQHQAMEKEDECREAVAASATGHGGPEQEESDAFIPGDHIPALGALGASSFRIALAQHVPNSILLKVAKRTRLGVPKKPKDTTLFGSSASCGQNEPHARLPPTAGEAAQGDGGAGGSPHRTRAAETSRLPRDELLRRRSSYGVWFVHQSKWGERMTSVMQGQEPGNAHDLIQKLDGKIADTQKNLKETFIAKQFKVFTRDRGMRIPLAVRAADVPPPVTGPLLSTRLRRRSGYAESTLSTAHMSSASSGNVSGATDPPQGSVDGTISPGARRASQRPSAPVSPLVGRPSKQSSLRQRRSVLKPTDHGDEAAPSASPVVAAVPGSRGSASQPPMLSSAGQEKSTQQQQQQLLQASARRSPLNSALAPPVKE